MRPRHAIPTAMKKAEAIFGEGMVENIPGPILTQFRSRGTVATRYPDSMWLNRLPANAILKDYLVAYFLAYFPGKEDATIVAAIVVSMWQDDPFTLVVWNPQDQSLV